MAYFTVIEKREGDGFRTGPRYFVVDVQGVKYRVNVHQGKRVRIAYSAKWGFKWDGEVRDFATGKEIWSGEVSKSVGVVLLLEAAGLIPLRPKERQKLEQDVLWASSAAVRARDHVNDPKMLRSPWRIDATNRALEAEACAKRYLNEKALDDELRAKFGLAAADEKAA